jgi:hypothetical protein
MRAWAGLHLVGLCGLAAACAAHAADPAPGPALSLAPQDSLTALFDQATPASDAVSYGWRSTQVQLTPRSRLRVSLADPFVGPGAAPLNRGAQAQAYEVSLVRDWPGAVSFETQNFGVDLSPHAAVGVTPQGGLAEAGARLELSQRKDRAVLAGLNALGVSDGARFGDTGRWYLFAAASGRAVGLNMLHGEGGWDRAGWTTDQSSKLVGDAQIGVGWRKGATQTSLGLLHREVKGAHLMWGQDTKADTLLALSFAVRPGR